MRALAKNREFSPGTKHIALCFEPVKSDIITVANKRTKYLGAVAFREIMKQIKEYR